jgi:hypothetical protein
MQRDAQRAGRREGERTGKRLRCRRGRTRGWRVTLGEASGDRGQAAVWSRVLAALLGGNSCDLKEETLLLKTRASRRPPRRRACICLKRAGSKQEELFSAKLLVLSAVCQNATAERGLDACSLPAPRRRVSHLARTSRLDANATRYGRMLLLAALAAVMLHCQTHGNQLRILGQLSSWRRSLLRARHSTKFE